MPSQRNRRIVDLEAIRHNMQLIRSIVPKSARVMAVVKADAYGHGAVEVAEASLASGASFLAVATVPEGMELRQAGIRAPILVLGESTPEEMENAAVEEITLTVSSTEDIRHAADAARIAGHPLEVHLKVDTGMGRIGGRNLDERDEVLAAISDADGVTLTGIFTHFADADGNGNDYTDMQLARFQSLTAGLPEQVLRHCANSAAILRRMPEAAFDMVRAGIVLYGYPPVETELDFHMCMRWESRVMFVKTITRGECVSYGCTYKAKRKTRVATVGCGYGDGYHRSASGKAYAIVHGVRVPVIGRVCMDQLMVDVSDVPDVEVGDTVTLMGEDGEVRVSADDIASWAGTISYEILLSTTGRVRRDFINRS
ncbi:MAG: alanine racemase [Clostridia bacterium]|nr:alanine racemase [Clostridia bacterium]